FVIAFEMETIAISHGGIVFHDEASHHIRFFRLGTTRVHSANLVAQSDTWDFFGVTGPCRNRLKVIDDQIVFFDRNGIYFLNKSSDCRAHEGSPKINTTGLAEYETYPMVTISHFKWELDIRLDTTDQHIDITQLL